MITRTRAGSGLLRSGAVALAMSLGLVACDNDNSLVFVGPGGDQEVPRNLVVEYEWVLQGWEPGGLRPVGGPTVVLSWELPSRYDGDPFRIYARRGTSGSYTLIATVTSCAEGLCEYVDRNVVGGATYTYFVATADEARDREAASATWTVEIPLAATVPTPAAPTVTALDNAVYLTWSSVAPDARYQIFLEQLGSDSVFYMVGETDGTSFLDELAQNGFHHAYRLVAIDTLRQYSPRGPLGGGYPRPDYHAELIWALGDSTAASGFRFRTQESDSPLVSGEDAAAQWRLESVGGVLHIVPRGATTVTRGEFTTALTCGPGSDGDCESIDLAPQASAFSATPVPVEAGNTYVFRVTASDGLTHHGKVRVQGVTRDRSEREVVIFDWAYQMVPDVPNLGIGGS